MDSESSLPKKELVKYCSCGCSCTLMNNYPGDWNRTVKRKFDEFDQYNKLSIPGFDYSSVARIQIENECDALRETIQSQRQSIQDLYSELEEERSAASSAANEAMSMILRLQREKAEIQMESRQFKRFAEEKIAHDQEELLALEDLLYKREEVIQSLTCEVQAYKHRMLSYGFTEEGQFEFPRYDYPPLKCNINEKCGSSGMENGGEDIEKHAFGEFPHAHKELKNLESRISQMERSYSSNRIDGDFSASKNILEKVIVGRSPKQISTDSLNSFLGFPQEFRKDFSSESPRPGTSFKKKMDYISQKEDSNSGKMNDGSEFGDDASDRVYTIDAIHNGAPDLWTSGPEVFSSESGDPIVEKLYMRLQALEADRESMKQAIISMRTDKAQFVLLNEIAQHLCKDKLPERPMPVKKAPIFGGFSFMSLVKWTMSFVFWRSKAYRCKYSFGSSANNAGLLMLLDKCPRTRHWRCLISTQV